MSTILSRRDLLRRTSGFALATPLLSLTACDAGIGPSRTMAFAGPTMGTSYSVTVAEPPAGLDRRALKVEIDGHLETVNGQMSNWRSDSEISRFNAEVPGDWTGVSPDTLTIIEEALRVGRLSAGAFDPTIGPLVDLWGFGPGSAERRIPQPARVDAALQRTGLEQVRIRRSQRAVAKGRAGLEIDLSGIAKGFGVDKLAERLEAQGVDHYLVEIGGELRALGQSPRHRPWWIGIERPLAGRRAVQRIVGLDRGAIATSGNYRNFFDTDGGRYSHIIDPRSGEPVRHGLLSATVIAPTAMQADALSTALMVLGPDDGWALAEHEKLAALFILRDGDSFAEVASPAFERYRVGGVATG
jgi:thiamine biosynthesis lipoprotein